MLDEVNEAHVNLKKFLREVMMGGRNNTAEAREPLHSYPRGPRGGTGAGPIRMVIYIWIWEARLI